MRYFLPLLLLVIIIAGCSKKDSPVRSNFLELTLEGKTLTFDIKDTAVLDTVYPANYWEFTVNDNRSPYSTLRWVLESDSKWVNGIYEYIGGYNSYGRSVFYMYLTTYVNGPYESYYLSNLNLNSFKITIDHSDNGRLHGTISGTMTCSSCAPGTIGKITNGEFEMPYKFH